MPLLKLLRKASRITTAAALTQLPHNQLNFWSENFIHYILYTLLLLLLWYQEGCILTIFPLFTKHDLYKPLYADIKLC